jgi:hypothetical protein
MAFTPDSPFPKTRGHVIKSKDWNDAITEVQRLDTAKANKAGDSITGSLTIAGNLGVGTTSPTTGLSGGRTLHVDNPSGGSVLRLGAGVANGQQWEWQSTVINNVGALNLSKLTAPASNPLTVLANGNVGIGTTNPGNRLEVNGDIAISGKHAFRGNDPWLRLNQDGAFTAGVHTPGVFAPMSLNVGGVGGWGNPGAGNVWIAGGVRLQGSLTYTNSAAPMLYIWETAGGALERPILAHSQPFPDWGLSYRDSDDMMIFRGSGASVLEVGLGSQTVRLGASGGQVFVGGNRTGPFMQLNDDLWFSDPQNGTIQIRNSNNSNWGTLVGFFNNQSSIKYKKDTSVLGEGDLTHLLDDALGTEVVRYRYKGEDDARRLRLGVITENCPDYLVGDDGESLSTAEYIAMLHGAIKALAGRVAVLEK